METIHVSLGMESRNVDQFSIFRGFVLEGTWDNVLYAYKNDSCFHKFKINESRGTTLHVAVNEGQLSRVNDLVDAILDHEGREVLRGDSALKTTNERGDTPLHLAASRGFTRMCKCIIGEHGERKDLIKLRNKKGETPLFRTAITGQKRTFVYLHDVSKGLGVSLKNYDGDTILHRAIWSELLDLAIIIIECYPELLDKRNKDGVTPLEVLANKPSVFKSGSSFSCWKKILFYCSKLFKPLRRLDAKKAIKTYMEKVDISEDEYKVIVMHSENEAKKAHSSVLPNLATIFGSVKDAVIGRLPSKDLKGVKKIRQMHIWSGQLLDVFMKTPYESYMGISGDKPFGEYDDEEDTEHAIITSLQLEDIKQVLKDAEAKGKKPQDEHYIHEKETAFLAAVKNGIVEIVFALQSTIPSAIHENTFYNENVLFVAVKNRQPKIVELLHKNLDKKHFSNLIIEVDNKENTVLHLAASPTSNSERTWQIAGTAMQMMWDIKWYKYIKTLVPEHFTIRKNTSDQTPWVIFEENHKTQLKECTDWLKETSNSCSVVAALIAGVSFATSSTLPGGTEQGKPALEGQPAFDAFAITSLIGLGFSVTALIMFLSILTARKQAQDFSFNLPLKLLLGLSSLFISIASMLVSFCAAHFFLLKDKYKNILFPVYVVTCLPASFYAVVQFPLYLDLVKAILQKVPQRAKEGHF